MATRPPLDFEVIKAASVGRFVDTIFPSVGIQLRTPVNNHQPCPMCGGADRFRCDNKRGEGTWICNQCGAGNGFMLVQQYTRSDAYETNALIASALGIDGKQTVSDEQRAAWQAQQVERESAEREAKRQARLDAAKQAQQRWEAAKVANNDHAYLQRKQVDALSLRQDSNGNLLIPMHYYNTDTKQTTLVNLQSIAPDGTKLFIKGGLKKGAYFTIGNSVMFGLSKVILICEGYATGMTVFDAMGYGYPVIVAFDAGNLLHVAPSIRAQYPDHRIIICADNDQATAIKTGDNVGINKATAAAGLVGGEVVYPDFNANEVAA